MKLEGLASPALRLKNQEAVEEFVEREVRPEEGVIPTRIFTDPDLYKLELDRVFGRCWLFAGHESEVPQPGDYVTRQMGGRPIILARGEDGNVRIMLNVCRHRGMKVCRSDMGNSSHFRCPYHAFTYRNNGELIGVPFEKEVYGDTLNKSEMGLIQARTETYKGLIFGNWDENAPSLDAYLGDMKWYLDLVACRAEMEVLGSPQRYEISVNWKLPSENFSSDAYHTASSHASIAEIGLLPSRSWAKGGYQIRLQNGHGVQPGLPAANFIFVEELMPEYERHLAPEQFEIFKQLANCPGNVFPNLSFLISAMKLKGRSISHTELLVWEPKGPDKIESYSYLLVEKNAPDEWKELSRQAFILTFGTAGMLAQDDSENWIRITEVVKGIETDRMTLHYGLGLHKKPTTEFPGPGEVYPGKFNEVNARSFYQHWKQLVLTERQGGLPWPA